MALVEHERHVGALVVAAAAHDLDHDAEQLERVGGPDDEVVVGVVARVEVERAELAEAQQLHDDELDVGARRVMSGIEAHHRLVAERSNLRESRTPVGNIGVVERRLEELVLQHEALVVAEARIDGREALGQVVLPAAHVVLARVVGTVREPDLEVARAGRVHDVDALEVVVDRALAGLEVTSSERAEFVLLILESVRVDRSEGHTVLLGVGTQSAVVVDLVPRNVQRD